MLLIDVKLLFDRKEGFMKVIKQQSNSTDCLVCGIYNKLGLHANFYEMEDGSVVALAEFKPQHQSYPDRTHGGMIASLIDETIGRVLWITEPHNFAVTSTLTIKYRKPVPYGAKIKCIGKIISNNTRGFTGEANIIDESGAVLASGTATYVRVPLDKVNNKNSEEFLVDGNDPLNDIDI